MDYIVFHCATKQGIHFSRNRQNPRLADYHFSWSCSIAMRPFTNPLDTGVVLYRYCWTHHVHHNHNKFRTWCTCIARISSENYSALLGCQFDFKKINHGTKCSGVSSIATNRQRMRNDVKRTWSEITYKITQWRAHCHDWMPYSLPRIHTQEKRPCKRRKHVS